jgi:hypothetical protein
MVGAWLLFLNSPFSNLSLYEKPAWPIRVPARLLTFGKRAG